MAGGNCAGAFGTVWYRLPFFGKEPLHGNIPLFSFGLNIFKLVAVVVNIGCLIGKIKTDIGIPDEVVFNDGAVNRTSDFQKCVAEEFAVPDQR